MSQMQKLEQQPNPGLKTIKMVEETLKNMDESLITVAGLKKILPKQVNHNTLMVVLDYLEECNKITTSLKGITYLGGNSLRMKKLLEESIEHY